MINLCLFCQCLKCVHLFSRASSVVRSVLGTAAACQSPSPFCLNWQNLVRHCSIKEFVPPQRSMVISSNTSTSVISSLVPNRLSEFDSILFLLQRITLLHFESQRPRNTQQINRFYVMLHYHLQWPELPAKKIQINTANTYWSWAYFYIFFKCNVKASLNIIYYKSVKEILKMVKYTLIICL